MKVFHTSRWLAFALAVAALANAAVAAPPVLELPVRCTPGRDCFIQNFVDRDPGPGFRDFRCGPLAYDGHAGTDFRVANLAAMNAGVAVLAAAPGVVLAVRDGEEDISFRERREPLRPDRMAGNAVRIDHGDGWVTQYSHLRRGSVRVQPGQRVVAGEALGQIGLSGNTEFPHVDFAVSRHGQTIDPFSRETPDHCVEAGPSGTSLWSADAARLLRYQPTGLLSAGFSPTVPSHETAKSGAVSSVGRDAEALCFWYEIFGLRQGDEAFIELRGPDGEVLARTARQTEKNQAVAYAFVGKKRRDALWPAGRYVGSVILRRGGATVLDEARTLVLGEAPP